MARCIALLYFGELSNRARAFDLLACVAGAVSLYWSKESDPTRQGMQTVTQALAARKV